MESYAIHPYADRIPPMTNGEYEDLKANIGTTGQREPIVLHEGKVIDGRHRLRACEELGVAPKVREWDGEGSLIDYIFALNLNRRHLTTSQRAMLGAEYADLYADEMKERQREGGRQKGAKHREEDEANSPEPLEAHGDKAGRAPQSRDLAAARVGVSPRYISDAKRVKECAPDLIESVRDGKMTLNAAMTKMEQRSEEQHSEQEATPLPERRNAKKACNFLVETISDLEFREGHYRNARDQTSNAVREIVRRCLDELRALDRTEEAPREEDAYESEDVSHDEETLS